HSSSSSSPHQKKPTHASPGRATGAAAQSVYGGVPGGSVGQCHDTTLRSTTPLMQIARRSGAPGSPSALHEPMKSQGAPVGASSSASEQSRQGSVTTPPSGVGPASPGAPSAPPSWEASGPASAPASPSGWFWTEVHDARHTGAGGHIGRRVGIISPPDGEGRLVSGRGRLTGV